MMVGTACRDLLISACTKTLSFECALSENIKANLHQSQLCFAKNPNAGSLNTSCEKDNFNLKSARIFLLQGRTTRHC